MAEREATELDIGKLIVRKSKRAVVAVRVIDNEIKKREREIDMLRRMRGPLSGNSEGIRFSGAHSHDPDAQLEGMRALVTSAAQVRILPSK